MTIATSQWFRRRLRERPQPVAQQRPAPDNLARIGFGVLLALGVASCATGTLETEPVDASSSLDGAPGADGRVTDDARGQVDGATVADASTSQDGCVLGTPESCSECGVPCPGLGQSAANVECRGGGDCTFSCSGENYDVNGLESDGCERADLPTGNHSQASATYVGDLPCTDGLSNPNISAMLPSDDRVHENPSVAGLVESVGAAPDWYRIHASGGLCQNNVVVTLSANGSGGLDCYKLSVDTDKNSFSCTTDSSGNCTIDQSALGQYSDGTEIYMKVEKNCLASLPAVVTYSITGHL